MRNLVRLRYAHELNNPLLHRNIKNNLPDLREVKAALNQIVTEVEDSEGNDVSLLYCFGNRNNRESYLGKTSFTTLFFPEAGRASFKMSKQDFWLNQGTDPISVYGFVGSSYLFRNRAGKPGGFPYCEFVLLYSMNPFLPENNKKYRSKMPLDFHRQVAY